MTLLESLQRSDSNPMQSPQYFLNLMAITVNQLATPLQKPVSESRKQKAVSASHNNLMINIQYSSYPGQSGHVSSGSTRSYLVYKISGSNPDSTLNHMQ